MKIENLEDLNDFLEEKRDENERQKDRIEDLEFELRMSNLRWQLPTSFIVDDLRKELPYPRLEMRLKKEGNKSAWIYGIVCRRYESTDLQEQCFVPLNKTTTSERVEKILSYENKLPYRDGFHVRSDMVALSMRAFFVCKEAEYLEEIELDRLEFSSLIEKSTKELIKM